MVYGYSLENCRGRKSTVGSNPTPSAIRRAPLRSACSWRAIRVECPERSRRANFRYTMNDTTTRRASLRSACSWRAIRVECPERSRRAGLPMQYAVYIVECGDGSLYVGHTHDLEQRMSYHSEKRGALHVAHHGFGKLIYSESAPDHATAIAREKQIKRWSRAKKLALVRGDHLSLKALSRSRT